MKLKQNNIFIYTNGYPKMNLSQLPAKSDGTTVTEHTEHVVIAAENLLARLPMTSEERHKWLVIIKKAAVLHDIGKIHPHFQDNMNLEKDVYFPIRHEIISLWILSVFTEGVTDAQAFAIATHHKGVMDSLLTHKSRLSSDVQIDLPKQIAFEGFKKLIPFIPNLIEQWATKFNVSIQLKPSFNLSETAIDSKIWLLLKKKFQPNQSFESRRELAETRALLMASDHIGSGKEQHNIPFPKSITYEDFAPCDKKGNKLEFREFQKDLQKVERDVLLYAPTGSGKTEAALNWLVANREPNARFFYLLPYTASINAMVKRLEKIFGKEQVTALHSKTLDFFYSRLENQERLDDPKVSEAERHKKNAAQAKSMKYLSRELFYPVKVATPHQVLKNALMGKGWEMSLFDYKKACFVIDEFHAYEPLLTGLLLATLKWLKQNFEAKLFFMSATIPNFLKKLIIKEIFNNDNCVFMQPIGTEDRPLDKAILGQKRHKVKCRDGKRLDSAISEIEGLLNQGESVLIVLNNVKTCQEIFESIVFNGSKRMLHSGFNRMDREEIEGEITNEDENKRPKLLVATQAVEVSLDIDYNFAFIENAPIDALIQRFGRVNRKGSKGVAPIYLFEELMGNTPFYDDNILKETWKAFKELENQDLSESDLVLACDRVYKDGYTKEQWEDFYQGFNNSTINQYFEKIIAANWENWVEEAIENKNMKIEVLCGNMIEKFEKFIKQGDIIRAYQLLVSVYRYEIQGTAFTKDEKKHLIIAYDLVYDELIGYKKKVDSEISIFL